MKKYKLYLSLILSLIIVLGAGVTLAYLYMQGSLDPSHNEIIGTVDFNVSMYHENDEPVNAKEVILNGVTKPEVYELNVSNTADKYHINKFRVHFENESNIETYLRVRPYVTLTLTYITNAGIYVELNTVTKVEFNIPTDNWYYDNLNHWYYYNKKIQPEIEMINFIISGLEFDLKAVQYTVQFKLEFEAVQSHLGPEKNGWGENPPWNLEGDW